MRAGSGQVIWKSTIQGDSSHCDFAHQQHKQVAVHFFTSQLMPREGSFLSWAGSDFCSVQGRLPKLTTHCQLKKYLGLKKTFHHTYAGHGSPYRQCSLPHCQPGQLSEGHKSAQHVSNRGKWDRSFPNNRDIKLCWTKGMWIIIWIIVQQDINQTPTS